MPHATPCPPPARGRHAAAGGTAPVIHWACAQTPLGTLLAAATARGLCFVAPGDDEAALLRDLHRAFPRAEIRPAPAAEQARLGAWLAALEAFLAGDPAPLALPLDDTPALTGSAFRRRVWRALQEIPRGEVRSYAEVAAAIGAPGAARAVGSACAANRVALVIPCHRVRRGDGGDGGFRWGLERKRRLLRLERGGAG